VEVIRVLWLTLPRNQEGIQWLLFGQNFKNEKRLCTCNEGERGNRGMKIKSQ